MEYFDIVVEFVGDITSISPTILRPFLGTIFIILIVKAFKIVITAMIRDFTRNKSKLYGRVHSASMFIDIFTVFLLVLFLGRYIDNISTFISLFISSLTLALKDIVVNAFYGIYIRKHKTFKIGDRIEVNGVKGDVVNFSRLTFDILEVKDEETGQSTGCIVSIPNNFAASKHIKNYNGGFKCIWTELKVNISRDADIEKTKEELYEIVNSIDAVNKVPIEIERELANIQTNYKIYYNDCKPIIYVDVHDKYYEFDIRYLMDAKKIRNVDDELWIKIVDADKKGKIALYREK
ncbi:MAG: mechanosensitive ion channel family protein [Bacilli bacterium]|nr:mechanosensitive ion channel family protein [Bacilli bacterium]